MDVTVAPDGTISFPLLGTIDVDGKTYTEIRDQLTGAIAEYYTDPQVAVNILELQNQKVIVIGPLVGMVRFGLVTVPEVAFLPLW